MRHGFFESHARGYLRPFSWQGKAVIHVVLGLIICCTFFIGISARVSAAAGINQVITFQGKVVNSNGTNVTDGMYDFVFKLYNGAASGSVNLFTESWTAAALWSSTMTTAPASAGESLVYGTDTNESTIKVGQILTNTTKSETVVVVAVNTGTNTVTISPTRQAWATSDTVTNKIYVKDGLFRAAINTLNADLSGVDFNSDTIFLGINFNADGEMKPRVQLSSAPYALNSTLLDGRDESAFSLLAGRSGGQTLIGGTGSGENLTLTSTSHGTKGAVTVSSGSTFGINDTTPDARLDVDASANEVALGVSGYSLTGSNASSLLDLSGTWNTSGTPSAIKLNITDTTSNAASTLLSLQTGGGNRLLAYKDGGLHLYPQSTRQVGLNIAPTWNNVSETYYGLYLDVTDTTSAADSKFLEFRRSGGQRLLVYKDGGILSYPENSRAIGLDLQPTWNNAGTTYDALAVNATDTSSAAGSRLLKLQTGSSDRLTLNKDGGLALTNVEGANNYHSFTINSNEQSGLGLYIKQETAVAGNPNFKIEDDDTAAVLLNFDNAGRLGLGRTSAGEVLELTNLTTGSEANVALFGPRATTSLKFNSSTDADSYSERVRLTSYRSDTTTSKGQLGIFINTGSGLSEIVRIDDTGEVGIGQTTPTARLHITPGTAAALQIDPYGASAGNTGDLRLLELAANGTNYVGLKAPDAITSNLIWTLPSADGSSGQLLKTNGSGTLSWTSSPTFTGWRVTHSAAQTLSTGSWTSLNMDTEGATEFDSDAFHDTVTTNTRATVPTGKGGKYHVGGSVGFTGNATGTRDIGIWVNGSLYALQSLIADPGGEYLAIDTIVNLAAGDYVELRAVQTTGGNYNTISVSPYSPVFWGTLVGS